MPRRKKRGTQKQKVPDKPPEPVSEEEDLVESGEEEDTQSVQTSDEDHQESSETEEEVVPKKTPVKKSTKKAPVKKSVKKTKKPTKKTPVKKEPTKKSEKTLKKVEEPKKKRFFKILLETIEPAKGSPKVDTTTLNDKGGRYTGHNPMQAAKKACRRIARASPADGECCYIFSVQETTQGSPKKVFRYVGERLKLDQPSVIHKGTATYNVYFDINVRSYKGPESLTKKPKKRTSS